MTAAKEVRHDWTPRPAAEQKRRIGPKTFRRDYASGYHSYTLDGEKCTGVTTLLGAGLPKPQIIGWTGRTVAEYCWDNRDVLGSLDREAAVELAKGAPNRDRDKAARRGTEVHTLAQRLQAGEEVDVPDELTGHVDAYMQWLDDWKPEDMLVELTVINRQWRYMGTLDGIATIPGLGVCLFDIKTTRSGIFGETALQIGAYRHAETYLQDGVEVPMPAIDWCGTLWIRSDGYSFIPVDAGPETFRAFLYVQQTARLMDRMKDLVLPEIYPGDTP